MLFNTFQFILVFLPICLVGYFLCARVGRIVAQGYLVLASFVFYATWSTPYGVLLVAQLTVNFWLARSLSNAGRARLPLFIAALVLNLGLLGYFKYANFFLDTVGHLLGTQFGALNIILPLAISFHTFQQVAYLVDTFRGKSPPYSYVEYALFVLFFPQLIAGPIVHHWQLIPQFRRSDMRFDPGDFSVGLSFFVLGLAKKVLIADQLSGMADPVFDQALAVQPDFVTSWIGLGAFTFGLYFDFSAYSDMAVGLARMFGIRLPYNFNSPYRSTSIIDFWKRWHITLSTWLRDYLYIPLGGNRKGPLRRYVNLVITMLLGGLWHGASWNFVIWGGLHGFYLVVNHGWRSLRGTGGSGEGSRWSVVLGWGITMAAVSLAWVFFRSPTLEHSGAVFWGLAGQAGLIGSHDLSRSDLLVLLLAALIAWMLPNTQEIIEGEGIATWKALRWRPNPAWAAGLAFLVLASSTRLTDVREFVYFQF